jgi:hypothetical protein
MWQARLRSGGGQIAAALILALGLSGCIEPCNFATADNLHRFAGCAGDTVQVFGFSPVQPAFTLRNRFPSVRSLNPTLEWQPTPLTVAAGEISNVRYDVIIWKGIRVRHADDGSFGDEKFSQSEAWISVNSLATVYERHGLMESSHTVESPLEPNTEYAWSVRARFELDGETRVSEWSLVKMPEPLSYITHGGSGYYSSRQHARLTGQIPPYALYYFTTPRR